MVEFLPLKADLCGNAFRVGFTASADRACSNTCSPQPYSCESCNNRYDRGCRFSIQVKLQMPQDTPPALHFLLTDDYLSAANHGQSFTSEGLRVACRVQSSFKARENTKTTPIKSQKDGKALMEEIWQTWIAEYKKKPDAPARHAAAEREMGEKLSGFLLREFISNAHDANAGDAIGGRGGGLRTILTICDIPRIHSGVLSFCFDRRLGQKALTEALGNIDQAGIPLMRLPFPIGRSREPARLRRLIDEYDTVFILPFRNEKTRTRFLTEWDNCIDDVMTLLYLPAIDHIIWERDDKVETTKRIWMREKGRNSVRMLDEGTRAAPPRIKIRPAPRRH